VLSFLISCSTEAVMAFEVLGLMTRSFLLFAAIFAGELSQVRS